MELNSTKRLINTADNKIRFNDLLRHAHAVSDFSRFFVAALHAQIQWISNMRLNYS